MDIVTHGLAGALVARAVRPRTPWPGVMAAVGGGLAPDLDVVARLWDPLAAITVHRTLTHSFVGGLLLATAIGAVSKLGVRPLSFAALAAYAYLGVLSHIGLDLLNPFGTAVLWPFTPRRLGLGWLYVLDPVVTGLVVVALGLTAWRRAHRPAIPRWALTLAAIYTLVAGALSWVAEAQWSALLTDQGVVATRVTVIPTFPGPLRWVGVAEASHAFYRAAFSVGRPSHPVLAIFPRESMDGLADVDRSPAVRTFLAFARFPWRTVTTDGDGREIEYWDLAFEDHPFGGPMALRITVDHDGIVRAVDLGHKL
jgi:inner membrane protein